MSGKYVFVVLPTRYGKSMCFACLPKAYDKLRDTTGSIVVVVTTVVSNKLVIFTILLWPVGPSCFPTVWRGHTLLLEEEGSGNSRESCGNGI